MVQTSLKTQLGRFIAVGVVSAIIDLGLTLILDYLLGVPRAWAKALGWVAGTITAYLLNSKWTFNSTTSAKSTIAVAVLYSSTFAVQNVLYWALETPLAALGLQKNPSTLFPLLLLKGWQRSQISLFNGCLFSKPPKQITDDKTVLYAPIGGA